jgi:hypothetical protein
MTFPRITKRDNPATIQKQVKYYEDLLNKALTIAVQRAKRQSRPVKEMVSSAYVKGWVTGYKAMLVAYPNPTYKSTWLSSIPWSLLDHFTAEDLADEIIATAKMNLHISKTKDPRFTRKDSK